MFALLETRILPEKTIFKRPERAFALVSDVSLGLTALWATVDFPVERHPKTRLARMQYALGQLSRRQVSRLVTPQGFGYYELLPRYRMMTFAPEPLYRPLAARMTGLALAQVKAAGPGPLSAAIVARRVTPEVYDTVRLLAGQARQVSVVTEDARQVSALRRRLGVPLLENPPPGLLFSHTLLVLFEPVHEWSQLPVGRGCFLLFLCGAPKDPPPVGITACDGAQLTPPARLEHPSGVDKLRLALALTDAGVLGPHDLGVAELTWQGRPLYGGL